MQPGKSSVPASSLLLAAPAFAQTEPSEPKQPKERYPEVEEITFDPVEIVGERKKVAGLLFLGRADEKFPPMIDERVHFKRDLVKSIGASIKKSPKATETEPK